MQTCAARLVERRAAKVCSPKSRASVVSRSNSTASVGPLLMVSIGNEDLKEEFEERAAAFDPTDFWKSQKQDLQFIAYHSSQSRDPVLLQGRSKRIKKEDQYREPADLSTRANLIRPGTTMDIDQPTLRTEGFNPYEGDLMAKQLHEKVEDFLMRLPPSTTSVSSGPWIWVANPHLSSQRQRSDVVSFKESGGKLLEYFRLRRLECEAKYPQQAPAAVTHAMRADRKWLEQSLVKLAQKTKVTTGKWMLFPTSAHVDNVWRQVVTATSEGMLGCSAKVATDDGSGKPRLICIYTEDFSNGEDVKRVLRQLQELRLVKNGPEEQGIFYKCDAYTHLDIMNGNEYKIKASLFASKELFRQMGRE